MGIEEIDPQMKKIDADERQREERIILLSCIFFILNILNICGSISSIRSSSHRRPSASSADGFLAETRREIEDLMVDRLLAVKRVPRPFALLAPSRQRPGALAKRGSRFLFVEVTVVREKLREWHICAPSIFDGRKMA